MVLEASFAWVVMGLAAPMAARMQDEPGAGEYKALVSEFEAAREKFSKLYQSAKTDEERQKAMETYPRPEAFAPRFLEVARKHPKSPAALDALVWIVSGCRSGPELLQALSAIAGDHIENEKIEQVCEELLYSFSDEAEKLLRKALDRSPHKAVQGKARFALAKVLQRRSSFARPLKERDETGKAIEKDFGPDFTDRLGRLNADDLGREAEKLLEQAIEKYGDIPFGGKNRSLADAARGELFELRNLAIGKVAPEIDGEDIDGKPLKLTEHRGKVVVLDFWGNW
jgi:tetratricopeptide (TPR) repeat protein